MEKNAVIRYFYLVQLSFKMENLCSNVQTIFLWLKGIQTAGRRRNDKINSTNKCYIVPLSLWMYIITFFLSSQILANGYEQKFRKHSPPFGQRCQAIKWKLEFFIAGERFGVEQWRTLANACETFSQFVNGSNRLANVRKGF